MHDYGKAAGGVRGLTNSPAPRPRASYPSGTPLRKVANGWVPDRTASAEERIGLVGTALEALRRDRDQRLAKASGPTAEIDLLIHRLEGLHGRLIADALVHGAITMESDVLAKLSGDVRAAIGEAMAAARIRGIFARRRPPAIVPRGNTRPRR